MLPRFTLLLTLLAAVPLLAQTNASINGDVTDASGAAVPGAKVKVGSVGIGVTLQIIWRKTLHAIWRTLRVWTNWRGSRKRPESSPLIGSASFSLIWRVTAR